MERLVARSKVTKAHSKYTGLRTAIPWEYVVTEKDMRLKKGDFLIWEWRVVDGEKVLTVRKEKKG